MTCMPVSDRIGPTDPKARLRSVDAVRGFALFGVLLVNMFNFGADAPEWTGILDRTIITWMHMVFETKSLRLFSLLFGLGFALQFARLMSPGVGHCGFTSDDWSFCSSLAWCTLFFLTVIS